MSWRLKGNLVHKPGAGSKPVRSEGQPRNRWLSLAVCLFLALAVWAVFGQTLQHAFVNYDDDVYVYDNPKIAQGLSLDGAVWAFKNLTAGFWHPLTWLSLMADGQFYGLRAGGYHLSNVLCHMANTLLLFVLLYRLTGALWRSGVVALLFGVHPLHVESVAWIAERKDVLSTLFWMLTLLFYARCARVRAAAGKEPASGNKDSFAFLRSPFYWFALLCFACGLMSKPMVVTLPLVMLLLDYWPLQRFTVDNLRFTFPRLVWEKLPFFVLALAGGWLTLYAEKGVGALPDGAVYPFKLRAANAALSGIRYLWQTVWPARLAVIYPYPKSCSIGLVLVSGLLLALISLGVLRVSRRHPYLAVGWFWYVITLVPVSGLIQVGNHSRADRYTYVPLIGIFLMTVWGAVELCGSWRCRRALLGFAAAAILAGLMAGAYVQTGYWKDSVSLWTHTLAYTSGNASAHNNLGAVLAARAKWDEAVEHYERALQLDPGYALAHYNLGSVLARQGKLDEAISHYERALQFKPDSAETHNNLGNALGRQGKLDEAISHYERALQLKPDSAEVHNNLGNALARRGRWNEAVQQLQQALNLATTQNNPALLEAIRARLKSWQRALPQPQTP